MAGRYRHVPPRHAVYIPGPVCCPEGKKEGAKINEEIYM